MGLSLSQTLANYSIKKYAIKYDGKISLCYFSLVLFSTLRATLDFKNKTALYENNRLISPSYLFK